MKINTKEANDISNDLLQEYYNNRRNFVLTLEKQKMETIEAILSFIVDCKIERYERER